MKVKDLYEVARHSCIELHSGYDGKMVASAPTSIEKFGEAEILSIAPRIKITSLQGEYAKPYMYVFVDHNDVQRIKKEGADNAE